MDIAELVGGESYDVISTVVELQKRASLLLTRHHKTWDSNPSAVLHKSFHDESEWDNRMQTKSTNMLKRTLKQ